MINMRQAHGFLRRHVERVVVHGKSSAAPDVKPGPRALELAAGKRDVAMAVWRCLHFFVNAEEHATVNERAIFEADVARCAALKPIIARPG